MGTTLSDQAISWMEEFFGHKVPNTPAAATPASGSAQPGAAQPGAAEPPAQPAATAAPPAAATPVAPPKTPDQERADLERRLKVSGPLYAKYGPAADDMVKLEDRLTPAEQKVGGVSVERTADKTLDGKNSVTTVGEKGVTIKTGASVTANTIGDDGKVKEFSREHATATTIGPAGASRTETRTTTEAGDGKKTVDSKTATTAIDLEKGVAAHTSTTSTSVTDTASNTTTINKSTTTIGTSGLTRSKDDTTQVGQQLDGTTKTGGLTRSDGQIGLSGSYGAKSGTMTGPADKQVMEKGAEVTGKGNASVVSDDKGVGAGLGGGADSKLALRRGLSMTSAIGGGGKCQSSVVEVPNSDPPQFKVTTTISFEVSASVGGSGELAPKDGDMKGGDHKGSVTLGASGSAAGSASFTHVLGADEAQAYLEAIQQNGRGGKLPEHKILATGVSDSWPAAKKLWASMGGGGAAAAKGLKEGEAIATDSKLTAGQQAGLSGGETREGGLALGGSYSQTQSHAVSTKKEGLPGGDVRVTATVTDASGAGGKATVGMGVASGSGGATHEEGTTRTVVFVISKADKKFDTLIKQVDAAKTAVDIDKIAAAASAVDPTKVSTTQTDQQADGTSAGMAVAGFAVDLSGKGTITNSVTRDGTGKVTETKSVGTNKTGGTAGIGDLKVGDSETQSYTGSVKGGTATGEIADQHTSTSLGKTVQKIAKAGSDPLGTLMHPSKLIGEETNTEGTAVADPQIMAICADALNVQKWNSKVGGMRMKEWIATGDKIRAAIKQKDGQIVDVDKSAVQKALAEWTKSDDGHRTETLDSLVRPLGGVPTGKAFAFPDGTESFKPKWDALVIADPLEPLRDLIQNKPGEAFAKVKDVRSQLQSLSNGIKSAAAKWAGYEVQHAEMLGHINDRIGEVDKRLRALQPKPAPAAGGKPDIGPPSPAQTQAEDDAAAKQKADDVKADLQRYNDNIEQMKTYAEAVFGILGKAEARMKDDGIFSDNAITRLLDAGKMVKQAEDQIKIWDKLYWPTYQLYEKLSQSVSGLDKSRLEKYHVAGAQARCKQVYDMTRDTSMTGRM